MKYTSLLLAFIFVSGCATQQRVPAGFTPLAKGNRLLGWHVSRTSHQGTTPSFILRHGLLQARQQPFGQGGILLTNKKFKNFEFYAEVKLDSFCNSGIFLRATESGQAYQVELAEPGGTGNLLGEMLAVSKTAEANKAAVWKANNWNRFRVRMTGAVPTITLWINGAEMWTVTEPKNDFIAGATAGFIGLQVHWSAPFAPGVSEFSMFDSWRPGGVHRFRNLAIKELP